MGVAPCAPVFKLRVLAEVGGDKPNSQNRAVNPCAPGTVCGLECCADYCIRSTRRLGLPRWTCFGEVVEDD